MCKWLTIVDKAVILIYEWDNKFTVSWVLNDPLLRGTIKSLTTTHKSAFRRVFNELIYIPGERIQISCCDGPQYFLFKYEKNMCDNTVSPLLIRSVTTGGGPTVDPGIDSM